MSCPPTQACVKLQYRPSAKVDCSTRASLSREHCVTTRYVYRWPLALHQLAIRDPPCARHRNPSWCAGNGIRQNRQTHKVRASQIHLGTGARHLGRVLSRPATWYSRPGVASKSTMTGHYRGGSARPVRHGTSQQPLRPGLLPV